MPFRTNLTQVPLTVALLFLTGAIFTLDMRDEYEGATWLLYFILAIPVAKLYSPRVLLFAISGWSLLIAVKLVQLPPTGHVDTSIFNRSFGMIILWTMAFLLYRQRSLGQLISEEEHRVTAILDGALDAVIAINAHSRITAWNPQAEKMFGFRREEAVGKLLPDLIIPLAFRDAHTRGLQRFVETGDGPILNRRIEVMALHRDGREFPVELSVMPLRSGRTVSFCAFVRDITSRKELETTLHQAREVAESASQAKSDFVANISHEIRTPLNAICGTTELLLTTCLTPAQRRYAEMCLKASHTLLELVTELLDFSRIESGRLQLELKPYDLRQLVERTIGLLSHRAEQKGLVLSAHIGDHMPALIKGDAFRLQQVLLNLVSNALKFTSQGSVYITAFVVDKEPNCPRFRLSVTDSGIGIPPEDLERIFDRFTQVDSAASRQHGGVGLGLAICKRLTELMGGRIWAESSPGKGSTFIVDMPFSPVGDSDSPSAASPPMAVTGSAAPTASEPKGLAILIAEDSAESRELIHYWFEDTPHRVESVADGEQAVQRYRAGRYDLVLMDLQMPGMDGFSATRAIRAWETAQKRAAVPIIALTANAFREAADQAAAAGCTGILTKPIGRSLLLDTVARVASHAVARSIHAVPTPMQTRLPADTAQRITHQLADRRPQFLRNRRKDLIALREAAACGDYDAIGLLGHRIKGIAGSYGFPEMGTLGHHLEAAAKAADLPAVQAQLTQMAALLEECDKAA
jgi:PAS domain S-box-containing protein